MARTSDATLPLFTSCTPSAEANLSMCGVTGQLGRPMTEAAERPPSLSAVLRAARIWSILPSASGVLQFRLVHHDAVGLLPFTVDAHPWTGNPRTGARRPAMLSTAKDQMPGTNWPEHARVRARNPARRVPSRKTQPGLRRRSRMRPALARAIVPAFLCQPAAGQRCRQRHEWAAAVTLPGANSVFHCAST